MATSKISVSEGSGKNLATHSFTEDAVVKELQRIVACTSAGLDLSPLVSTANSSTASLGIGGIFTGTSENVLAYSEIRVFVYSNVASATDGLSIQQSIDGTNWDIIDVYTVPAATGKTYSIGRSTNFFRVVYTNGGTAQATFRLQIILCPSVTKPSSQRPQDGRSNDNDFEESLAYNMYYNGTSWDRDRSGHSRNRVGQYAVSSFRILGTAATPQNIFSIENPVGSGKKIAIKKLTISSDSTALLATVSPSIKTSRPASLPTGGTTLTAVKWRTTDASNVGVCRCGTASDGGVATAITATAGSAISSILVDRQVTLAGFISHDEYNLLPLLDTDNPFELLANESLLIQGVLANAATTHFIVNAIWEEYT